MAPEELESVPTIELLNELKRRHQLLGRPPARVALLGPPCAGKRTQAEALRRASGACRIAAEDLAREAGEGRGGADARAAAALAALLDRPQCRRGFVLEGLPGTAAQAQTLAEALERRGTPLEAAVFLEAPEETLLRRCRGRLLHGPSGRRYHEESKPPMEEGLDDFTGEPLEKAAYDEAKLQRECQGYREHGALVLEFFKRRGLAQVVSAAGSADEVAAACSEAVRKKA